MKIPIIIYEEVKFTEYANRGALWFTDYIRKCGADHVEWVDNNGTNIPYLVTTVNKET